jgi:hypothetical protein
MSYKNADSKRKAMNQEDKDNCLSEFINMVFYIEERLPYLTLMSILNKQNVVTQNIQSNPDIFEMLSLNLMSVPPISQGDYVDYSNLDRLSKELSDLLISFKIRQRQFKDYTNTALPITPIGPQLKQPVFGMHSKFMFTIEFAFNYDQLLGSLHSCLDAAIAAEDNDYASKQEHKMYISNSTIEANSLEEFYKLIKLEWVSMCRMFTLINEMKRAHKLKSTELSRQMRIKSLSFKKIVIKYGPNLAYTIQFQWSKEQKNYELLLGVDNVNTCKAQVDTPLTNYHNIFFNEIRKQFSSNHSVVNLIQLLNYTCVGTFAIAKLSNLPKFYSKVLNQSVLACCGFMLIICSLTHFRLIYYSKYCLDIHIKPNGLVSIRDGSFGLTDINAAIDELCPIQFLSVSLLFFRKINSNTKFLIYSKILLDFSQLVSG